MTEQIAIAIYCTYSKELNIMLFFYDVTLDGKENENFELGSQL